MANRTILSAVAVAALILVAGAAPTALAETTRGSSRAVDAALPPSDGGSGIDNSTGAAGLAPLPAADTPSAAQSAADDAEQPAVSGGAPTRALPTCGATPSNQGLAICAPTDLAAARAALQAARVDGGLVNKRFEHCSVRAVTVTDYQEIDGVVTPVGEVSLDIINYSYSARNAQASINQLEFIAYNATGEPISMTGTGNSYNANGSAQIPETILANTTDEYSIVRSKLWDAPLPAGAIAHMSSDWTLRFQDASHRSTIGTWLSNIYGYRCDNATPGVTVAGCVAEEGAPVQPVFNVYFYDPPTWFDHVVRAMYSGLPGLSPSDPLTRTTDQALITANGKAACPRSLPRPTGYSCDEYPFRSTLQGAASASAQAGGPRTFDGCSLTDPEVYGHEGFSRCMIVDTDNSAGGGLLGAFYKKYRVLNNDNFYLINISPT